MTGDEAASIERIILSARCGRDKNQEGYVSMKVARLYKPRDLRIIDEEEPKLTDGNLLVKITSVGVCGSDVHWYQDGHIGPTYMKEPLVLGHEISAEVVSVGKGVTGVVANGALRRNIYLLSGIRKRYASLIVP